VADKYPELGFKFAIGDDVMFAVSVREAAIKYLRAAESPVGAVKSNRWRVLHPRSASTIRVKAFSSEREFLMSNLDAIFTALHTSAESLAETDRLLRQYAASVMDPAQPIQVTVGTSLQPVIDRAPEGRRWCSSRGCMSGRFVS
jgi:hypothetical protein